MSNTFAYCTVLWYINRVAWCCSMDNMVALNRQLDQLWTIESAEQWKCRTNRLRIIDSSNQSNLKKILLATVCIQLSISLYIEKT